MQLFIKKYPYWFLCILSSLLVSFYWGLIASERYVSEANVVLESPQLSQVSTLSFQSLLSGGGANSSDMLLLRDYLLSVDMLKKVEGALQIRDHYSSSSIDVISRLWDRDYPLELLHDYYLKHIVVELDEYAQILRIQVKAYSPEMAHNIARYLMDEGEKYMNLMGQRLAQEQVAFLEKQVLQLSMGLDSNRKALLDYQNKNGLTSPTGTVESINAVVANLESQLANLRAKRSAMQTYQSARSSDLIRTDSEISALLEQIDKQRSRMAQESGQALNAVSSEYQTLELKMQFAQESYSTALSALENTRIEAARKLKQLSVLQSATLPEYAVEPERLYNSTVFIIIALFLGLIVQMLVLIIMDHRD